MFDELANELKTAREEHSMTLAQVANRSKIDLKFLEAMEQGDFSFLPELYVRAFVKNFAKTVGLDENKIYKKYEAARKGIPYVEEEPEYHKILSQAAEASAKKTTKDVSFTKHKIREDKQISKNKDSLFTFDAVGENNPSQEPKSSFNNRNIIIGGSLLAVILLFTLVYFLFIDKSNEIIVVEKPIEDVIQQNQRYVEDEQSNLGSGDGSGISDSLVLTINANDTSWIKVSIDEQASGEFILLPNSQKIVKAKTSYKITLGNSGVIKLQLNNKQLSFAGKNKTPLSLKIDREGLTYSDNTSSQR